MTTSGTKKNGPQTILGVVAEPFDGIGYVRFAQPFTRLAERGLELRTLGRSIELHASPLGFVPDAALLDDVIALVFPQMVASPRTADGRRVEVARFLCEEAVRRSIPIVYSVDDHLDDMDPSNPGFEAVHDSIENLQRVRRHADALIVTTAALERSLANWQRPTFLLPNTIDPRRLHARPRRGGKARIGWAGSSSHIEDLLMLLPALERLAARTEFDLVVFGLTDRPLATQLAEIRRHRRNFSAAQRERASRFIELCRRLESLSVDHRPFTPIDNFLETLPQLDLAIGVCPLRDTPFNRHKSALKFYEYAAVGTLTVASAVEPYLDEVSVTVPNDAAAWADTLERFLLDPVARDAELKRQQAFVLQQRTIDVWAERWERAFAEIHSLRSLSLQS